MNLQHLHHLVALAETGSFSRASDRLHLTQPALSRSIQALEDELGIRLFDRIGKRNELTPYGEVVLERARRIVLESAELKRCAALLERGEVGTLKVGMGAAPRTMFASPLLSHMLLQHPTIGLHLQGGSAQAQIAALRERELDAMIVVYRGLPLHPDLHIDLFKPVRSGFLCRKGHPLASQRDIRFKDVLGYPIISSGVSDDVARTLVDRYGPTANPQRWLHTMCEDISALHNAMVNTNAIFLGVVATAKSLVSSGEVVELQLRPTAGLSARFAFVTLEGRTESPSLAFVRNFCSDLTQSD